MQTTQNIFLVRPANFVYNIETAISNSFQNILNHDEQTLKYKVNEEFDLFVQTLESNGISVLVFDDTEQPVKPDAVFPNNWISLHPDGRVILYPMCAANRRSERRQEILEGLQQMFNIREIVDLSFYEKESRFLEGTGSIVFDHQNKIGYACLSPRTDKELFLQVCELLQYKPIYFFAFDKYGKEIYHTNVMMCIAEKFCVICLESITDETERKKVIESLTASGHQLIEISYSQMKNFAGNMLQLKTRNGKNVLALSASAYKVLDAAQKSVLEKYVSLMPLSVQTIEAVGGGSVRCMIAENFLPEKEKNMVIG